MNGSCKHFTKDRIETDFELVAKKSNQDHQPLCTTCRDSILAQQTREIRVLEYQKESLSFCNESQDKIRPLKLPNSPHKTVASHHVARMTKNNTLPLDGSLNGLERTIDTVCHSNSVIEAKIKSQNELSGNLETLSMFTIEDVGERKCINGLTAVRALSNRKTSSLEISAALGQCCLSLACLMNAYNVSFSEALLLPAGPYSRISVSNKVFPLFVPSSKQPTQLEAFEHGLIELYKLVKRFFAVIRADDLDAAGEDTSALTFKHRDQTIGAILGKLDEILKSD